MFDKRALGSNIKAGREKIGLTQAQLADKLHVTFQAVSGWERGITPPEIENICNIAELYGVSLDALLFSRNIEEKIMIGIDGGGTKTEFVLFTESGEVLKKAKLPSSNPNAIGAEMCSRLLTKGIDLLIQGGYAVHSIFIGIAGGESSGGTPKIIRHLKKQYEGCKIALDSDIINVLACAENPENAMGIICGTGLNVFTRKNGEVNRIGGWGFLFDEGGSGYNIGRDAVRHLLLYSDGMCRRTLLVEYMEAKIGDIKKSLGSIYSVGLPKIASYTPIVFDAAEAGDQTANDILLRNASCVAKLIQAAQKKYAYHGSITAGGSLIANDVYFAMIQKEIDAKIIIPTLPPVYGACVECCIRAGMKPGTSFYQKFYESYTKGGEDDAKN